jgi:acyl-homoserine-lactone acylase
MIPRLLLLLAFTAAAVSLPPQTYRYHARIVRDNWGIAHVHGKTDADAVFGMAYAQAEDDFNRVEYNYLDALGWRAQADGASAIYADLRERLWIDPADLQTRYRRSPAWLRKLMDAWAAGLNGYLAAHPNVHPRVIKRFEPWMALSFSEGSIGGDITQVDLAGLRAFYGGGTLAARPRHENSDSPVADPGGSNGIAIAPKNTLHHHALLLINPHTTFYFRSELQMSSDQGLDAYGAVTWGQFFIYQGFNAHAGWMHTSSGADNVDRFAETIVRQNGKLYYRYGAQLRPVTISAVVIPYRLPNGSTGRKSFTVYHTLHGPIVASQNGKWIAEALMFRPVRALEQSYLRIKATDYAQYRNVAELEANSSNNTIFADDKGEIAFLLPQFIPMRDNRFDYTKPVDGSNPATTWQGVTPLADDPNIVNPAGGWVFNSNDWPWTAAGSDSPKATNYPRYMDEAGENARGVHARMLLTRRHDFTLEGLRALAFNTQLPLFAALLPALARDYDALSPADPLKQKLAQPMQELRHWDSRWSTHSIATSLAIFWADALAKQIHSVKQSNLAAAPANVQLAALAGAVDQLTANFGTWRTRWGDINRFQRLDDSIYVPHFDDGKPSIPVGFVAGTWGSLAAFYAKPYPNTKRWYGNSGNSFVAAVEFGKRVRAIAVTAGGESGNPQSPHFSDEAQRYATGNLREAYFYPDQLAKHTISTETIAF